MTQLLPDSSSDSEDLYFMPAEPLRLSTLQAARPLPARVYWRRRMLVLVVAVLVVLSVLLVTWPGSSAVGWLLPSSQSPSSQNAEEVYVVQPGDTLLGIAARVGGSTDVASAAAEIARRNNPGPLVPGQTLTLPAGFSLDDGG